MSVLVDIAKARPTAAKNNFICCTSAITPNRLRHSRIKTIPEQKYSWLAIPKSVLCSGAVTAYDFLRYGRSSWPEMVSATRTASATMSNVTLMQLDVGKTELLATYRLEMPCTRHWASTTPVRGLSDIRVVPIWWLPTPATSF